MANNFVETATLKLIDQASKPASQVNRELNQLWKTVQKLRNVRVKIDIAAPRNLGRVDQQIKRLVADANKLRSLPQTVVRVDSSQVVTAIRRIRDMQRAAAAGVQGMRVPVAGPGGRGGMGGMGATPNNMFWSRRDDTNAEAAGRIMARSFVAVVGVELATVLRRALATGGREIVDRDTAFANARAAGLDPVMLEGFAQRSAGQTQGVPVTEIMDASRDSIASLQVQLKNGAITMEEFNKRAQAVTDRIARTAEIGGTTRGDFAGGAREAREMERILPLTSAGFDLPKQQEWIEAFQKVIVASGGDMGAAEMRRMAQQLGPAIMQALSPEGFARLAMLREEGGRQATANTRMMVNDLIRGSLNAADTAQQQRAGLRDERGQTRFNAADLADVVGFAERVLMPLASAAGVDLNDTIALQNFFDNVAGFSTSGAREAASLLNQVEQNRRELERLRVADPSKLEGGTIAAALAEVNTAFRDAFGNVADSMSSTIQVTLGALARTITSIGGGQLPAAGDLATVGVSGAVAAGAVAAPAFLLNKLFNPLNGSAIALNGSAAALDGAAAALMRASGAQALPGMGGLPSPGTGAGARGPRLPTGTSVLTGIVAFDLAVRGATDTLAYFGRTAQEQADYVQQQLAAGRQRRDDTEEFLKAVVPESMQDWKANGEAFFQPAREWSRSVLGETLGNLVFGPRSAADQKAMEARPPVASPALAELDAERQRLTGEIAKITAAIETARTQEKIPGTAATVVQPLQMNLNRLQSELDAVNAEFAKVSAASAQAQSALRDAAMAFAGYVPDFVKSPPSAIPMPTPNPLRAEQSVFSIDAATDQIGLDLANASNTISGAAAQIDTTMTGVAPDLIATGPAIGSSINQAMTSAGSVAGDIIASKISAAAANINVNVRQNTAGPDLGKQLPQ